MYGHEKTQFFQCEYHLRRKYAGVQRDAIPRLWVSNRGEKHPCWHTILLAKSSVLYLLRPLTLERGWLCHLLCGQIAGDSHFSAAVGQADFVRLRTKSGFAPKGKSVCQEKEAKVYHPSSRRRDNALIPPRQLQPEIVQRQCFS